MTALSVTREYLGRGTALANLSGDLAAVPGATLDIQNTGDLMLVIKNGGMSSITATLEGQTSRHGNSVADKAATIAAGKTGILFFANQEEFNLSGVMQVTLSGTTSVTCGLYRIRRAG